MTPTREVFFNIQHVWVMYALFVVTLAIFGYGFYRHWRCWSRGLPALRTDHPLQRLRGLLQQTAGHERLLKRYRSAGFFHFLFFWGMVVLTAGTTVVFIHNDLGIHIMQGAFYLYFQSLALNVFGGLFVVGLAIALVYRYVARPIRLKPDRWQDGAILFLLLVILVTGFIIQGARIQITHDPWGAWSPVGNVTGTLMVRITGMSALPVIHRLTWWFHMALVFGFIAWIPYSKLMHLATAPANIYLRDLSPRGALPLLDIEKADTFGISRLEQFAWKDLFDLDACTECSRCEVNCPANLSNKPLSPKRLILDLQHASRSLEKIEAPAAEDDESSPLVGPVIREETLWSCTTCRACMEQCPVMIEQVPKIVGMRRHLVMERAEFPDDLQNAIRSLEARGHPYAGTSASRSDWHKGLDVHVLSEKPDQAFEVLLWVGCAGALNDRSKSVTRSVAQLLTLAGVKFAILSREEKCTGDLARRIGHEFLFQQLAHENIATFERYQVRKIVTACPHCFNTIRNEYPQLGGNYQVVHHSEFLQELVAAGRLQPQGHTSEETIVFHDPCYLGRYNQVYEAPRQVLDSISNVQRSEVPDWSGRNTLCCGGGGGFSFMEEKTGTRMSHNRSRQLLATGAQTVAVGCPFCMTMIEDGVKTVAPEGSVSRVMDIAEVLAQATLKKPMEAGQ